MIFLPWLNILDLLTLSRYPPSFHLPTIPSELWSCLDKKMMSQAACLNSLQQYAQLSASFKLAQIYTNSLV